MEKRSAVHAKVKQFMAFSQLGDAGAITNDVTDFFCSKLKPGSGKAVMVNGDSLIFTEDELLSKQIKMAQATPYAGIIMFDGGTITAFDTHAYGCSLGRKRGGGGRGSNNNNNNG